jgi:xylulokinase
MSLYRGMDSSTQGLKLMVMDPAGGALVASAAVNYGADLPEYGCPNGTLVHADPLVKHADPRMWAAALDLALERLRAAGAPLGQVAGISGSGQQHGSVYLRAGFAEALAAMRSDVPLAEQVAPLLSRPTAPIWMDGSTSAECAELTAAIGRGELQRRTGSPAIERFTGPQIRRFAKTEPEAYAATARIHLVSSFMASLLIGGDAPIDHGDGAGMNLLNLASGAWDPEIAAATAPGLLARLPAVVPGGTVVGRLHAYFARYGLRAGIPVVAWSGDNPCSLIGTGAWRAGTGVVSLGTSDTFFAALEAPRTDPDGCGHVFGSPAGGFMSLICFTNGSLARETVRDACGVDWAFFDKTAFRETPPGNGGNLMLPHFVPETTPPVLRPVVRLRGDATFCAGEAPPAVRIRAIVESQFAAMRLHTGWIGRFDRLRITGGGSKSSGVCQVAADMFQARVEKIAVADSAALGAAMMAAHAVGQVSWDDLVAKFAAATETFHPVPATAAIYDRLVQDYAELEREAVGTRP